VIEYSQVFVAIFRAGVVGEFWVSDPCATWAYPIGNTVGGQRVIVPAQVTDARRCTGEFVFFISSQATVASLSFDQAAFIYTETTGMAPIGFWRFRRQVIGEPRYSMCVKDGRFYVFKFTADTVETQIKRP